MNTAWNVFNFSLPPLSAQGREEGKEFRLGKPGTQPLKKKNGAHTAAKAEKKSFSTGSEGGRKSRLNRAGDTKLLIAGVHLLSGPPATHQNLKKRQRGCSAQLTGAD